MSVQFKFKGGKFFDTFKDEPVNYTQKSIDFQKVDLTFNDFSKSFMLPATDINNALFSHYYDVGVLGGFNPFEKNEAEMWVNNEMYSAGVLTLLNISLKDDSPTQYNVQFFSDTIDLKAALKDNGLNDLQWSGLDHSATAALMAGYLNGAVVSGTNMRYPMASVSNYWTFEGGAGEGIREIKSNKDGVLNREVRPSIPVSDVMDKIFENAGFAYEVDFAGNDYYDNLYMWIANGKPFIADQQQIAGAELSQNQTIEVVDKVIYTTEQINDLKMYSTITGVTTIANSASLVYNLTVKFLVTSLPAITPQWRYVINGTPSSWTNIIHNSSVVVSLGGLVSGDEIYIEAQGSSVILPGSSFSIENSSASATDYFVTNAYMPTMKCTDFINGILVNFNAILYWDAENRKFIIQHREDWFAAGKEVDISNNVDTTKTTIKPPTFYKRYGFSFEKGKDFANLSYQERNSRGYGSSSYDTGMFTGDTYENKSPFTPTIWNELVSFAANGSISAVSNIASFQSVDSSFGRVDSGVRLMYYNGNRSVNTTYKVVDVDGVTGGTPGNYNYFVGVEIGANITLAFNKELDFKSSGGVVLTSNLFTNFYEDYIRSIYNQNVRRLTIDAYIPYNKLKSIQLNDTIIIRGVKYWIDGMEVDLLNNKAKFDLINRL